MGAMTTIDEDVVTLSVLDYQRTGEERAALARLVAAAREGEAIRNDLPRLLRACGRFDGAQPISAQEAFLRCVQDVEDHATDFLHNDSCPTCRSHRSLTGMAIRLQQLLLKDD